MSEDKTPNVPRATYRVQMHAKFGFDATAGIADYLSALGVSHVYCSPYLQAGAGSTHGYDVLDHSRANEELGGDAAHARMCQRLGEARLGQVLDIVPNHMSIAGRLNAWWWDVLENGQASRHAGYFDVDWDSPLAKLTDKVLLPVLGDHYGRVLEAGEIKLQRDGGTFTLHYHDHVVPVAPRSLDELLADAAERSESDTLAFIADSFKQLPPATAVDRSSVHRRHRDKEVLRAALERLCVAEPDVAAAIDEVIAGINASADELDVLLERQNYRLAFWRTAGQELDYRRFFDINTLVSMRIEDERVFYDTHVMIMKWLRQGVLDGLRVDHPDGLRDPEEYCRRLQAAAPRAWIVVEKILEPGENLPSAWPVAGTTGYDFLNRVGGLLIDQSNEAALTDFYADFTGQSTDYPAIVREKKHQVLRELFGSDINRLASLFARVCERHRRYRDYTRKEIHSVLRETIACFPVYRTYVRAPENQISPDDERYTNEAIDAAKQHRPDLDGDLFDLLRDIILLRVRGELEGELVMRLQQATGPVMAKGVEDTTFYNYNRLTSLNEVGGDPSHFGMSVEDFHQACQATQGRWSQSMLASTTHDTKRSEDVRARMALLSEMPDAWRKAVSRWAELAEPYRTGEWPDRNIEYFLYQTLVGAWPIEVERVQAYLLKSIREAKAITSWNVPNPDYEAAIEKFVAGVLGDSNFTAAVQEFVSPLIEPGRINSLSQTLIKLTSPGVPDIYQGTELWTLSLVDPDNRRPVDYELRRKLLGELDRLDVGQIMARSDDGLPKLWLTRQTLRLRAEEAAAFGADSHYTPIMAEGAKATHVVAFSRGHEPRVVTVTQRLPWALQGDWADTALSLPAAKWHNVLTGETINGGRVMLSQLLSLFPVALLRRG